MNKTKVLLILTQDVLDRALVLAGEGDGRAQAPGEPPDCPPSPHRGGAGAGGSPGLPLEHWGPGQGGSPPARRSASRMGCGGTEEYPAWDPTGQSEGA